MNHLCMAPYCEVENIEDLDVDTGDSANTGSKWGTGGMATKIEAARMAGGRRAHFSPHPESRFHVTPPNSLKPHPTRPTQST